MTIEFNCPKCGALIAFDGKHAGKRAKCLTCGQKLVIPAKSFETPQEIAPPPEPKGEPAPGFYRAVFIGTWRLFVDRRNVTTLTFVVAVVCFKFFLATACCMNYIAAFIIWGWLFGFYLNVISTTAWDEDQLPEIELGTSITFFVYVLGPFFTFSYTLVLVELPFFLSLYLVQGFGVTLGGLWSGFDAPHLLAQGLLIAGLFVFPAAILTTAVGRDFMLLRPDYLLAPIFRALPAYTVTVALLAGTCLLGWHVPQYAGAAPATTAKDLALNLAVQVVAIFAMRSIGLFHRHYGCHFKW